MQLKYKVSNCLAFGNKPVEVDLTTPGLTLIQGKHLSSKSKSTNGVGKSSILNTAFWVYYGKYPDGMKKADMINDEAKGNCLGEGWITKGDKTGHIVRGISCKEMTFDKTAIEGDFLLFFLNGKDMRGATQADTQVVIEEFIGLDYDSFVTAALFTTSEASFSSKTSGKQEELFSKLLHLEDLEIARKNVKNRQKEVKDEVTNCDHMIDKIESHIDREKVRLTEVANAVEEWNLSQKEKEKRIRDTIDTCENEIDTITDKITAVTETISIETATMESMEEAVDNLDSTTLESEKAKLRSSIQTLDKDLGGISYKIRELKQEITQAQKMRNVPKCDKCFQEVPESHIYKVIEEKNETVEDLSEDYATVEKQRNDTQNTLQGIETRLKEVETKRNDVVRQASKLERVRSEKKTLEANLRREQEKLNDLSSRLKSLLSETLPQSQDVASIEKEIAKLKKQIDKAEEDKDFLVAELTDLDFCEKMFGPSGIRNLLVRSVIPKLNEQVNRFAEILTDGELTIEFVGETEVGSGKKVESRNKLDVRVLDRFGSEKYCQESGGEKRRVDICVNFALNYLVSSRIGLPFVMMDEIFLSLDNRGKEKVMELLKSLQHEIPSIFIISNQDDVTSSDFDNVWTVCRKGRQSWIA